MEKRLTKTNQISAGQIAFVLMAIFTAGKLFYLPGLMYSESGRDSWIAGAVLVALEWLLLFVIYKLLKKSGENNLYALLSRAFGKIAAKVILLFLAAFFILQFIMPVAEIYNFLNFVTMQKSNWLAYVIPLFALVWFVAKKGLTVIARNADIFGPVVLIAAALLFAFSVPAADLENIMPFGVTGAESIFSGVLRFSGWFSDCAVFLMFIGKSKNAKKPKGGMGLLVSSVITSALLIGFFVLFPSVFGATAPDQNFALARVSEFGATNFLGHTDRAAVTVWLFGSLLKISLFMYAAFDCVMQAFPVKNEKAKGGILAGLLGAAAVLPILFKIDFVLKDMFAAVWFLIPAAVFTVVMPLYLLFIKGARNLPAAQPVVADIDDGIYEPENGTHIERKQKIKAENEDSASVDNAVLPMRNNNVSNESTHAKTDKDGITRAVAYKKNAQHSEDSPQDENAADNFRYQQNNIGKKPASNFRQNKNNKTATPAEPFPVPPGTDSANNTSNGFAPNKELIAEERKNVTE